MTPADLLTTAEAAALLDVDPGHVRTLKRLGYLAAVVKSPRVVLYERAEVERYRRERRPSGRPPALTRCSTRSDDPG